MPTTKAVKLSAKLVKILNEASERDLEDFDAEIARCEARLRLLKAAREVIAEEVLNRPSRPRVKVRPVDLPKLDDPAIDLEEEEDEPENGGTPMELDDAPMGRKEADALTDEVGRFLFDNGPCMRRKVVNRFGISEGKAQQILEQTDIFEKTGHMYKLTRIGREVYDPKFKNEGP